MDAKIIINILPYISFPIIPDIYNIKIIEKAVQGTTSSNFLFIMQDKADDKIIIIRKIRNFTL